MYCILLKNVKYNINITTVNNASMSVTNTKSNLSSLLKIEACVKKSSVH